MATDHPHNALFRDLLARIAGPKPAPADYHAYTKQFDAVVAAADLDSVIGAPTGEETALLRQASQEFDSGLLPWKTKLHIVAAETAARVREVLTPEDRANTVVSLLFDQSGSMRGQKILFAAASADICQEFLQTLGVRVEVLGFTTSRWRGGRSRNRWIGQRRPGNPGRLNDLLHIVCRDAEDLRASTGGPDVRQMLRPDLTKENIDGEALEWAVERLRSRPESRKILIVISDGAPVDDATLLANPVDYLFKHLKQVIKTLQESDDIALGAVGLGFDVSKLYAVSAHAEAPGDLGKVLLSLSERMLVGERPGM